MVWSLNFKNELTGSAHLEKPAGMEFPLNL